MENRVSQYGDPTWEAVQFDYEELSISKSIVARGQFGASYMLGKIHPSRPLPPKIDTTVMMKTCTENDKANCYNGLKSELRILCDLCHTNVIQLVGFSSDEQFNVLKFALVFEYCSNGNLVKVLQKGRPYFNKGTYSPKKAINNEILSPGIFLNFCGWHLLRWAAEIVRGMEYLAFKGVIHGDLSARNILLTCNWTAKVCNFSIAQRHKIQDDSFVKQLPKEVLPIAWMAPETIQNFSFSEASDVFSFGVTMWEIYTLGDVPYCEDNNITLDSRFWIHLLQGVRPSKPVYANEHIWDLMNSCWEFQTHKRPTFSKIKTFLERTLLATKSDWDAKLSGYDCSDNSNNEPKSSSPKKESKKGKSVTFAPQITGGFLRKCFAVTDDVLHRRLKTP